MEDPVDTIIWILWLFLDRGALSNNPMNLERRGSRQIYFFIGGVLIELAHYYASLVEMGRTIREGVLIEEGALTEGVRKFRINTY